MKNIVLALICALFSTAIWLGLDYMTSALRVTRYYVEMGVFAFAAILAYQALVHRDDA